MTPTADYQTIERVVMLVEFEDHPLFTRPEQK